MTPADSADDLILFGGAIPTDLIDRIVTLTGATAVVPFPPQMVRLTQASRSCTPEVAQISAQARLDFAYLPRGIRLNDFGLLAMDMDSTLITIECIDEVADFAGCKTEVSAITEAAMRGEMDYTESLRRRVALLAGLPESTLARVYEERLRLTPGVARLIAVAQAVGLHTLLVSGGFTYFTERLKIELNLDEASSNTLEIIDGYLTGRVIGEIVDAAGKARHVVATRERLGLSKTQVITLGDGANDLLMMAESGLSIAYRAKPVVRDQATVALNFSPVDAILTLLLPPGPIEPA